MVSILLVDFYVFHKLENFVRFLPFDSKKNYNLCVAISDRFIIQVCNRHIKSSIGIFIGLTEKKDVLWMYSVF